MGSQLDRIACVLSKASGAKSRGALTRACPRSKQGADSRGGGIEMAIDANKLQDLMGKMLGDVGAAMGTALVMLGDKFGFYKTLAAGPLTSAELASKTGTV